MKYQLKGQVAQKTINGNYEATLPDGLTILIHPRVIENPDFGWEKVEEFQNWKVGEWLYSQNCGLESIFRFKEVQRKVQVWHTEHYSYDHDTKHVSYSHNESWNIIDHTKGPATNEQIESMLSRIARHKGYKEGVAIISAFNGTNGVLHSAKALYDPKIDDFWMFGWCIYSKGTWSTILPEKATEPQVEGKGYLCIKTLIHNRGPMFTSGNHYVFQTEDRGGYWNAVGDNGLSHSFGNSEMPEYFDMGQPDWKTAKVFSYECLSKMWDFGFDFPSQNDFHVLLKRRVLEEEAKKRTRI